MKRAIFWVGLVATSWSSFHVLAQESTTPKLGWSRKLTLGSTVSFGTSDKVVGQTNGETTTLGLNVQGSMDHIRARDEWRNSMLLSESSSKTPSIPRYVKASDTLKLETLYLYTFEAHPWVGPYVKGSAESPVFKGEDIRSDAKTYEVRNPDKVSQYQVTGTSLRLTDGFRPLTTKESAGAFFKILKTDRNQFEARLGLGAMQVNADGQLALDDDGTTSNIEVRQLESYSQAGVEGGVTFKGSFDDKTSYSLEGEFLSPLATKQRAGDKRSKIDLTNWELKGRISSKLYEFLSVDYSAKVLRQPQLIDDVQLQTLLMVSLNYQLL